MDGLRELGVEVWFNLGDRDLAYGIERARRLDAGQRLTEAQAVITAGLGVPATVLPMSDRPVRTRVLADDRWWGLQEFLIRNRGEGEIGAVEFRGAAAAAPTPEVLAAIADARAIIIGPSNPIISIGPILALPGLREALIASRRRPSSPSARSSAGRSSRARPPRFCAGPGIRSATTASPPATPG